MNDLMINSIPANRVAETARPVPKLSSQDVKTLQADAYSGNVVPLDQGKSTVSSAKVDLSKTVDRINELIQGMQRELQFSVDDASGRTVVTVRDSKTREVIRQIPSEEVLAMAERLAEQSEAHEKFTGILVEGKV